MSEAVARTWKIMLTASTFAVLATIPMRILFGMEPDKLGAAHFGLIAASIGGMLLLPVVDRLIELNLSPTGFSAKLDEVKKNAAEAIAATAGPAVAEAVRPQLELATTPEAVHAIREVAVNVEGLRLNVAENLGKIDQAIRDRRVVLLCLARSPGDASIELKGYPFDIKKGRTPKVADQDYVWVYDPAEQTMKSPRLSGIRKVEVLNETFDPAPILATFKEPPAWNVPRDW